MAFFKCIFIYLFIFWLWWAARRLFPGCSQWGLAFIAVHGPLSVMASLVAEHRL